MKFENQKMLFASLLHTFTVNFFHSPESRLMHTRRFRFVFFSLFSPGSSGIPRRTQPNYMVHFFVFHFEFSIYEANAPRRRPIEWIEWLCLFHRICSVHSYTNPIHDRAIKIDENWIFQTSSNWFSVDSHNLFSIFIHSFDAFDLAVWGVFTPNNRHTRHERFNWFHSISVRSSIYVRWQSSSQIDTLLAFIRRLAFAWFIHGCKRPTKNLEFDSRKECWSVCALSFGLYLYFYLKKKKK